MAEKNTLGRQKISMVKIENEDARYTVFSKLRSTLYKKASELVGKYELIPNTQPNESNCIAIANSRNKVKELKVELDELDIIERGLSNPTSGTEETDMKKMWKFVMKFNEEELNELELWLNSFDFDLKNYLSQLENDASSSTQAPPENVD
uniref:Mads box protein n=1 Tax=Solanum tuberosum TaxID=4113 RepID=M1DT98_SOLTU